MLTCKNIIIFIVYCYVMMKMIQPNDTNMKIAVTVVAVALVCYGNEGFGLTGYVYSLWSGDEGFDAKEFLEKSNINNNTVTDNGMKQGGKIGASSLNTGPYDGLCLKTGNEEYWMKSPDETTLLPNDKLYTYLGSMGPIKMRLSEQSALRGPPVDGVPGSDEKMFMLANNVSSPLCCPSTFSTSTGCLCTTKNQRDFISARGTMNVNPANDINTEF